MKILLLGDFSTVQLNLKNGLEHRGHDVTLISHGDGFKKVDSDIKVYTRSKDENKYMGALKEIKSQFLISKKMKNYDVVQTAAHIFFHNRIDNLLFPKIFNENKKTVLLNTACSYPYNLFVKKLQYSPCQECKKNDLTNSKCDHEKINAKSIEFERYDKYNAIVSTHYEYYQAFNDTIFKSKNNFIPIPINLNRFEYDDLLITDKINIYYGEIRKGFKGGVYIEEALEKIRNSPYSKYFNIIVSKKLTYTEYLKVISSCHVLIDQASSYSYGVNAIIGLSKGKVVLSGAEPESVELLSDSESSNPIINIKPNSDDIYNKLLWILENKHLMKNIGLKGRDFIKKFHSLDVISEKYEKLYLSL